MAISIDDSDFQKKSADFIKLISDKARKATVDVASEILRLSQFQVPHDTGELQNSGQIDPQQDETLVGYNKVYAARLHEHPEYHFQGAPQRKGKYLEDPIKNNMSIWRKFFENILN
jgi:hypothetical protein